MSTPEPHLLRRIVQVAADVHGLGVARKFSLDKPIAVRLPGEESVWYAAFRGPPEDEEWVCFAKGPLGLRYLRDLADGRRPDDACAREVELLEVEWVPLHSLAPAERAALRRAGVLLDAGEAAPEFTAKRRNRSRAAPEKRDFRLLEWLLAAFRHAGLEEELDFDDGRIPTVDVVAGEDGDRFEVASEAHADDLGRAEAPVRCSDDSETWPIVDARWVLGVREVPSILPGGRDRALLFILDAADGSTIRVSGPGDGDDVAFAREFVRGLWIDDEEPGFAREMLVVGDGLRARIAEALEPRGVVVTAADGHPFLDAAEERCRRQTEDLEDGDDIDTWRVIAHLQDAEVGRRVEEAIESRELYRRYFGGWRPVAVADDEDDPQQAADLRALVTSAVEWAAFSWRRRDGAPTIAERMIREEPDDRSLALLAAHIEAPPSLQVVRAVDGEAETLTFEDALSGERVVVHDRALAQTAAPGVVLAARVVPAGPFRMIWRIGPAFREHDLPAALAEIERCGVRPTAEGIREHPEVFGKIWRWAWERRYGEGAAGAAPGTPDGDEPELR